MILSTVVISSGEVDFTVLVEAVGRLSDVSKTRNSC